MKSWISKALLGLCIAAPATMAELPTKPGRYGGLYLSISSSFSGTQATAIRNSFGLWLQNMMWDMSYPNSSGFRVVNSATNPDLVSIITIKKVSGVAPGLCPSPTNLSRCGYTVSKTLTDEVDGKNPEITIYTQLNRDGVIVNTKTSDPTIFQNMMTTAVGYLLAERYGNPILSGRVTDDNIYIPGPSPCGLASIYAPTALDYGTPNSACGYGYQWSHVEYPIKIRAIVQFSRYNASNVLQSSEFYLNDGGLTIPGRSIGGKDYYRLSNARFIVVSGQGGVTSDPQSRKIGLAKGRIAVTDQQGNSVNACYMNPTGVYTAPYYSNPLFTVGLADQGELAKLTNYGMALTNLDRVSLNYGDILGPSGAFDCATPIGWVADVLNGN